MLNRIFILLLAISTNANSTLIEADIFGDGGNQGYSLKIPLYNIQWLDFGLTNGMTVKETLALTESGQIYEGFRIAEADEVLTLWQHLYYSNADHTVLNPMGKVITKEVYAWAIDGFQALWATYVPIMGSNRSKYETPFLNSYRSVGIFKVEDSYTFASVSGFTGKEANFNGGSNAYVAVKSPSYDGLYDAFPRTENSTFLVKDISVSEPDAILIFMLAITLIFLCKRSRFLSKKVT
jgi:hypothetical protein